MTGRSRRKLKSRKRRLRWLPVCLILAVLAGTACFLYVQTGLTPQGLAEEPISAQNGEGEHGTQQGTTHDTKDPTKADNNGNSLEPTSTIAEIGGDNTDGSPTNTDPTVPEPTEPAPRYTPDGHDTLPLKQADPDLITLRFAGDILFDESYAIMASLLQRSGPSPDISRAFDGEMLSLMRGADIFMLNNEFPYSLRGAPLQNKQFTFRARPQYASLLKEMGADIVGLANNHVNDHGREAMLDTFDTLDGIGMPFVGAGRDLAEASRVQYFTNGQVKIGIVAATQIERLGNPDTVGATEESPGVFRCMNPKGLVEKIREADALCDCVIVFVHWGSEGKTETDSWQEDQAVQFAEAGADVIIGAHPHVLQKIVSVRGVPCVFSLGNYLFNSKTLDTGLAEVTLNAATGEVRGLRFIPALQSGCRTVLLSGTEKERVLDSLRKLSKGTTIGEDGSITFS
ncbi:MAG: CapA family protein [Lachnospiraceae bacterium]|nr:CapA family protein [Lachnospiraceae bacterium]